MKNKFLAMMLSLVVACGVCNAPVVSYAAEDSIYVAETVEFKEGKVTVLDAMKDFGKAEATYSTELTTTESQKESCDYFKFTIDEDSLVKITVFAQGLATANYNAAEDPVCLYSNSSMSNKVKRFSQDETAVMFLDAGTYYMSARLLHDQEGEAKFRFNFTVGAVPVSNLIKVSQELSANKDSVTVSVNADGFGKVKALQYVNKLVTFDNIDSKTVWYETDGYSWYNEVEGTTLLDGGDTTFTVKNNGTYTVRVTDTEFGLSYSVPFEVSGIDTTAPVISGAANGKTYKNAVTIKFSDKESGIKTATLNGSAVKTGKKISKAGSYTLKVTDKAGNTKTIKFKIKK